MNNRLKEIRKEQKMSQEAFANKLGYNKNYIYLMESGKNPVTDRAIKDICREFRVNETWLRTGEGDMKAPEDREQEIARITAQMYKENDSFRAELIKLISQLTDEQMEVLKEFAIKLGEKAK